MRSRTLLFVGALLVAACGGALDGALEGAVDGEDVFGTPPPTNEDGSFDTGAGEAGPVTVTTDPSQALVSIDGKQVVYSAIGTIHYECLISEDRVSINYQSDQGQDLLIQGGIIDGGWLLNVTFTVEDEGNVAYGATLPGGGSLGLGDNQLSYEGTIDKVEDRDILNPTPVDGTIAVNCSVGEGQPTAVIDGTEYVISMVGADSSVCEVSNEIVTVQINRLTDDGLNLDIGVEAQEDGWFGHVSVTTPQGNYLAKDSPNPVGLTVEGSTVTYQGTFEGDAGDVEGSVVVNCS